MTPTCQRVCPTPAPPLAVPSTGPAAALLRSSGPERSQHVKRLTCHELVPGCSAVLEGTSSNELVHQYVIHAALRHRHAPVLLEDLLDAITTVEPRGTADRANG